MGIWNQRKGNVTGKVQRSERKIRSADLVIGFGSGFADDSLESAREEQKSHTPEGTKFEAQTLQLEKTSKIE